jgi:hypothetical protein
MGETSLYIWRLVKRLLRKVLAQGKGGDEQLRRTRERTRLYVWYVSASFERPGSSRPVSSANQFVSASPINSLLLKGSSSLTDGLSRFFFVVYGDREARDFRDNDVLRMGIVSKRLILENQPRAVLEFDDVISDDVFPYLVTKFSR